MGILTYLIVSKGSDIPKRFSDIISEFVPGETVSSDMLFKLHKDRLLKKYNDPKNAKAMVSQAITYAKKTGIIQRCDELFIPEWFEELKTTSYWQSQLRGSRLKNSDSKDSTRSQYLYHLWNFQKWLSTKTFEINTLHAGNNDMFVRKTEKVNFKNVEELLNLLERPFADSKNIIRIAKQYLLDECHKKTRHHMSP